MSFLPRAEPPARKKKEATESKTLGSLVDHIYNTDQEIAEVEAQLRMLKQTRAKREARLLEALRDQMTDGCKGRLAIANIKVTRHPGIKDRAKLDKWIIKNNALHLLQNRVTSSVYFELLEDGAKIPGIEVFEKTSLSITKRRK